MISIARNPMNFASTLLVFFSSCGFLDSVSSFQSPSLWMNQPTKHRPTNNNMGRRAALVSTGMIGGFFGGSEKTKSITTASSSTKYKQKGPTNEIVKVVDGMKHKRLGGSDIIVSEMVR